MVTFISIFLGVLFGVHDVEVAVPEAAHSVELRLDGLPVAEIEGPPWAAEVDFGERPAPGRLEAVAYDLLGEELGRAEQWVNVPRPAAAVEIVVERDPESGAAAVVLSWESLTGAVPVSASVTFDGERLESADPHRWELLEHDPEGLHFLRAELDFPGSVTASAERFYGGGYRDELSAVATAVIVGAAEARDARRLDALEPRFVREGLELAPVAVERGPFDLVFVVSGGAVPALAVMARRAGRPTRVGTAGRLQSRAGVQLPGAAVEARAGRDWRAQLLWPVPFRRQGERTAYDLFPHSQLFTPFDGRLHQILALTQPPPEEGAERLADAVAVAGLAAAEHSRRRAVVILAGGAAGADASDLTPGGARSFLADLQVPLEVWSATGDAAFGDWGEAVDVSSLSRLERATGHLFKTLSRQRVMWLQGAYLPHEVRLRGSGLGRRAGWTIESSGEWVEVGPGTEILARPERDAAVVHRIEAATEIELLERRGGWGRAKVAGWWGWVLTDPEAPDLETEPLPDPYAERIDRARSRRLRERLAGLERRSLGSYPLYTDVDDRALLDHLEAVSVSLEAAYRERYGLQPGPPDGALFILFRDREAYRELAREELAAANVRSRGQSSFRLDGAVCCAVLGAATYVGRSERDEVRQIVVHELVHLLNRRTFGRRLPLWLEEGLAEDLAFSAVAPNGAVESARLGGERGALRGAGRTGVIRSTGGLASLRTLLDRWPAPARPSLAELFAVGWRDLADPESVGLAYSESGFLVRHLLAGGETAAAFRAFLAATAAGGESDAARLLDRLGTGPRALESDFYTGLRRLAQASGVPIPP